MKTKVVRTALAHREGRCSLVAPVEPRVVRTTPLTQKRS